MIELLKKMNNFIQTELKKDLSITGKEYMELAKEVDLNGSR